MTRMKSEEKMDALFAPFGKTSSPGCAVAVMRGGETVYEKCFGNALLAPDSPITPDTVFHVASLTKQFTAMCITLLETDGMLKASDDVRKYLPALPDTGRTITLKNLMNHTGGLREQWDMFTLSGNSMEDLVSPSHIKRLLEHQKNVNFAPGEEYLYCNSGYTLLAMTVHAVTGKSIRNFAKERIFEPLGMTSTFYRDAHGELCAKRARSYRPDGCGGFEEYALTFDVVGSTGLNTTIRDLCKWLREFRAPSVLPKEAFEKMVEQVYLNDGTPSIYARGVKLYSCRGLNVREHTGSNAGYRAVMLSAGDTDVVVLSNYMYSYPILRGFALLELATGEKLYSADMDPYYSDERTDITSGRYASGRALAHIDFGGDRLTLDDGDKHEFIRIKGNLFVCTRTGCRLYATKDGFAYYTSLAPAVYSPFTGLALNEQLQNAINGLWYSSELQTVYEARADRQGVTFTHMKAGDMRFERIGEEAYIRTDAAGTSAVFRDGSFFFSKERTRDIRFVRAVALPE